MGQQAQMVKPYGDRYSVTTVADVAAIHLLKFKANRTMSSLDSSPFTGSLPAGGGIGGSTFDPNNGSNGVDGRKL